MENNLQSNATTYCIFLDTNSSEIKRLAFTKNVYLSGISCTWMNATETIIGGYALDTNFLGSVIARYHNDTLTDSLWIGHHWVNYPVAVTKFGSKYVFGHNASLDEYLTIVDEDFSNDTTYRRSSSIDPWIRDFNDFIVSPDGQYLYALGIYDVSAFAIFKYNLQMQEVRRDTLLSIWDKKDGAIMWSKNRFCDYRTPDSIFMVGGMSYSDLYISELTPSLQAPLQVVLADTAGNFHWSRLVGDQDSAYYYPWTVAATSDGGALIFSGKYDHRYSTDPHYMLSVIKIQGNGDVLSEKEYPMATGKPLEIFPNPVKEKLRFELPKGATASTYSIISMGGELVASGKMNPENTSIDMPEMKPGIYMISLSTSKGENYLGRFVKK